MSKKFKQSHQNVCICSGNLFYADFAPHNLKGKSFHSKGMTQIIASNDYLVAPSILTAQQRLIGETPQRILDPNIGVHALVQTQTCYSYLDPELRYIYNALASKALAPAPTGFFNTGLATVADVRHRQEAVRELVTRPKVRSLVDELVTENNIFARAGYERGWGVVAHYECDPAKTREFLEKCAALQVADSAAFKCVAQWGEETKQSALLNDLYRTHRKITDQRVIVVFSPRHKGLMYGVAKPGVKLDDMVTFLAPDYGLHTHEATLSESISPTLDAHKKKDGHQRRPVVKYPTEQDEETVRFVLAHGRDRLDNINIRTAQMSVGALFLVYAQLRELQTLAQQHLHWSRQNLRPHFPEVVEDPGFLKVTDLLPMRLVEDRLESGPYGSNSLDFSDQKIILIRGQSNGGKSEAARSVHAALSLANRGGSVLAKEMIYCPPPASYFVSCKGPSGRGGSELKNNVTTMIRGLQKVIPESHVTLDELGDATNDSTGYEIANRVAVPLHDAGCRVVITAHNDGVAKFLQENCPQTLGSYTTNPKLRGRQRFALVPCSEPIDYNVARTLDGLTLEKETVANQLKIQPKQAQPKDSGSSADRPFVPKEPIYGIPLDGCDRMHRMDQYEDFPF